MPTIREEIANLDPIARRRHKALRLAENAASRLPISWSVGAGKSRTTITISAASFDGEALRLGVSASQGAWAKTDDLVVINPPIMVPTGRKIPNPAPDPDSAPLIDEYEENPVQAIRKIVEDVVRQWQGGGR